MRNRIGLVVLLVAILGAAAAALLLAKTKEKVERATAPVEVAAPDLFPPETLLFAAAHRMDESWSAVESYWKRVEPTATWHLLKGKWDEARERGTLPPGVKEGVAEFGRAMDAAEARLGYRPDTRQFFETYGRYTAFGLLPGEGTGRPRMLLVVKLPGEAAMEMLRQKLGGVARRNDPPEIHGYPVFREEGGRIGSVLYGIGGGYLFVADDAAVLGNALGRLSAKAAPAGAPAPSLAGDAVFRRTVPAKWEDVGLAFFVRRSQQFARWDPNLKVLDDYLSHAFVLAPGEDAIAMAAVRIPASADFDMRASFAPGGTGGAPWADVLPSGTHRAAMAGPPRSAASREALLADVEAFRGKRIWKEADALLRDGPRLRRLLEEALGPEGVPGDEVLRRLPADADLLASSFREAAERAALSPTASWCFAQKTTDAGGTRLESVLGVRFGPLETFLLAAALDLAVDEQGKWLREGSPYLERESGKGFLAWRLRLTRILEEHGRDFGPLADAYKGIDPSFVVSGGVLWLTLGDGIYADMKGLAGGKVPPLSSDPIFREAMAAVPEGASVLDYARPAEVLRGYVEGYASLASSALEAVPDREPRDVLAGLVAGVREVALWEKGSRATVTATYADPSLPSRTVVLVDPVEEKAHPGLQMAPAALAAPGFLPAGTCLLAESRVEMRPAAEAFIAAFLRGLPGGGARWEEIRKAVPAEKADLEGRIDALLLDMKGEAGIALASPQAADVDNLQGTQDLLDRIPALVVFASYAHPDAAFDTVSDLFGLLAKTTRDQTPFEVRKKRYDRGQGPVPVGTESVRTEVNGNPLAAFRVFWPEAPRGALLSAGLAVVRRGDLLFLTTSLTAAASIAGADPGGPGTLGERMARELPAGILPAECAGLFLVREDGFADCLAHYARPLAPQLAGFSLRPRRGPPAPDRIQAHRDGWHEFAVLLEDLLRTGKWSVGATVREGDRLTTTTRRVPGKSGK